MFPRCSILPLFALLLGLGLTGYTEAHPIDGFSHLAAREGPKAITIMPKESVMIYPIQDKGDGSVASKHTDWVNVQPPNQKDYVFGPGYKEDWFAVEASSMTPKGDWNIKTYHCHVWIDNELTILKTQGLVVFEKESYKIPLKYDNTFGAHMTCDLKVGVEDEKPEEEES